MRSITALSEHVRARGGKVTPQRVFIWRAIAADESHPTAEDVFARLQATVPNLSLGTVYHTLNELVEWGDIRRFDTGDGRIHFDPNGTPHAEVICMRCHQVLDAPEVLVPTTLPDHIAGYRIVARSEQFYGYCPACQAQMADAPPAD